jgi:TP901 family phage tail tape measure protein
MTLAELVIKMSADTASLRTDFDKAKKYANDFASEMKSILGVIGASLSVAGFAKVVSDVGELGKQIELAGQKSGMGAKEISGLKFAADQSGISFETLQTSLARLSKNITDLTGKGTPAAKVLQSLGVSASDANGHIRPMHDILLDVADKFSKMPDGVTKSAEAIALFGRGGAALIPLLDQGSAGIKALEEQAALLGITFDDKTAAAAARFNDSLGMLGAGLKGLGIQVGNVVIPYLNDLLVRLIALKEESANWTPKSVMKDFFTGLTVELSAIPATFADIVNWNDKATQSLASWANKESQSGHTTDDLTAKIAALNAVLAVSAHAGEDTGTGIEASGAKREKALERWRLEMIKVGQEAGKVHEQIQKALAEEESVTDRLAKGQMDFAMRLEQYGVIGPRPMPDLKKLVPQPIVFEPTITSMERLGNSAQKLGQEMSSAFTQMIIYGKGFEDSMKRLATLFAEFIIKAYLFKSLAQSFFGMGGTLGGILGKFFTGLEGKQGGGHVSGGQPYVVGESGPELFMPNVGGQIVPGGQVGGQTVHIDARGADAGVEYRVMRAMKVAMRQAAVSGYLLNTEMAKRS